jgi:hypothetical protein
MTYPELVEFCGNERQAYFLSTKINYREMTAKQLENAVIVLMCRVKERTVHRGRPNITLEYLGGCRRDTLR